MTEVVEKKKVTCSGCTRRQVYLAYQRSPWFRLIRGPLKFGMLTLVRFHDFDFDDYNVPSPGCYHCVRYAKNVLKERSRLFCLLNFFVKPAFGVIMTWAMGREEDEDKSIAQACAAMADEPLPYDGDKYIQDPKWYKI